MSVPGPCLEKLPENLDLLLMLNQQELRSKILWECDEALYESMHRVMTDVKI